MSNTSDISIDLKSLLVAQQRNNGYLARQEIAGLIETLSLDAKRLEPFGFKVYSQGDEDGIIEEIFRRLKIRKGKFCEIGVENGLECNTLYLIQKGWTGFWVEGNICQLPQINSKFQSIIPSILNVRNELVSKENINKIINEMMGNDELDFLSIDIDGNDVHIFDALERRPTVICIEYNSKFPGNISKRQVYNPMHSWRGTDYFGSSLKGISEIASAKGYRLVGTNLVGTNAFFVRDELAGGLFADDARPESLYNPPRYYLVFDHYQHIGHKADFGLFEDFGGHINKTL